MTRTTADWLVRLEPYVIEWETANTNLWHENHNFDLDEFNLYLRRYMTGTRLRIVEYSHPEELPDPTPSDMYPSYDTSGSRQYAVRFFFYVMLSHTLTCKRQTLLIVMEICRLP